MQFKKGDRVRRVGLLDHIDVVVDGEYVVVAQRGRGLILEGLGSYEYDENLFVLLGKAPEPFNLKVDPWYIDTEGMDPEAVQQWLFEQGIRWPANSKTISVSTERYFTNVAGIHKSPGTVCGFFMHGKIPHPRAKEIKLSVELKLVVNSVEYPSTAKETRRDELEETIRKAQEELNTLN